MKLLDHLEEWLIAFLMGAATLLIFVAVHSRILSSIEAAKPRGIEGREQLHAPRLVPGRDREPVGDADV